MKTTAVLKIPGQKGFNIEEIELNHLGAEEVLVEMKNASICGTDIHIWQNDPWTVERIKKKVVVGHEGAGIIKDIGKEVDDFKVGDRVAFESHIFCDKCSRCRNNLRHLCENMKIIGADTNGLFSKYVIVPARNLWKLSDDTPTEHAAIFEPLGNAIYCITKANVRRKNILVLGCGPAGLFTILISKNLGAQTIVGVEKSSVRIELAKKMGASVVYDSLDTLLQNFKEFDIVFEMSGNEKLIQRGLELVSPTGTFIAFGIPYENKITLDYVTYIIYKCINVQGIHGRLIFGSWYQLGTLYPIIRNELDKLFTHKFNYLDVEKGIFAILNNLTDAKYSGSAFINPDLESKTGKPFYLEPGMPQNFAVGFEVKWK